MTAKRAKRIAVATAAAKLSATSTMRPEGVAQPRPDEEESGKERPEPQRPPLTPSAEQQEAHLLKSTAK